MLGVLTKETEHCSVPSLFAYVLYEKTSKDWSKAWSLTAAYKVIPGTEYIFVSEPQLWVNLRNLIIMLKNYSDSIRPRQPYVRRS